MHEDTSQHVTRRVHQPGGERRAGRPGRVAVRAEGERHRADHAREPGRPGRRETGGRAVQGPTGPVRRGGFESQGLRRVGVPVDLAHAEGPLVRREGDERRRAVHAPQGRRRVGEHHRVKFPTAPVVRAGRSTTSDPYRPVAVASVYANPSALSADRQADVVGSDGPAPIRSTVDRSVGVGGGRTSGRRQRGGDDGAGRHDGDQPSR